MKPRGNDRCEDNSAPPVRELKPPRRDFLNGLWFALGSLVAVEYVWLLITFLRPRKRPGSEAASSLIIAGPMDQFPRGSVTAFPGGKFYLARLEDGGFLALSRECTHLGCTVPWIGAEKRFVCPCHSSAYDITGEVLNPPAPRALDIYPVRIENGIVKVDTEKATRRNSFEGSQVTRS